MKSKKKKLKPWVKVSLLFIFSVAVVSQIFTVINTQASKDSGVQLENYSSIDLEVDGEVNITIIRDEKENEESEVSVDQVTGEVYSEVVTLVIKDGKIVDYYTSDEETTNSDSKLMITQKTIDVIRK